MDKRDSIDNEPSLQIKMSSIEDYNEYLRQKCDLKKAFRASQSETQNGYEATFDQLQYESVPDSNRCSFYRDRPPIYSRNSFKTSNPYSYPDSRPSAAMKTPRELRVDKRQYCDLTSEIQGMLKVSHKVQSPSITVTERSNRNDTSLGNSDTADSSDCRLDPNRSMKQRAFLEAKNYELNKSVLASAKLIADLRTAIEEIAWAGRPLTQCGRIMELPYASQEDVLKYKIEKYKKVQQQAQMKICNFVKMLTNANETVHDIHVHIKNLDNALHRCVDVRDTRENKHSSTSIDSYSQSFHTTCKRGYDNVLCLRRNGKGISKTCLPYRIEPSDEDCNAKESEQHDGTEECNTRHEQSDRSGSSKRRVSYEDCRENRARCSFPDSPEATVNFSSHNRIEGTRSSCLKRPRRPDDDPTFEVKQIFSIPLPIDDRDLAKTAISSIVLRKVTDSKVEVENVNTLILEGNDILSRVEKLNNYLKVLKNSGPVKLNSKIPENLGRDSKDSCYDPDCQREEIPDCNVSVMDQIFNKSLGIIPRHMHSPTVSNELDSNEDDHASWVNHKAEKDKKTEKGQTSNAMKVGREKRKLKIKKEK